MRTLLAIPLLLGACSGAPTPGPVAPPKPVPVVGAPSCADAGVLLRGNVSDEAKVGKLKEELIAKICTTDAWDAKVLACVASSPTPVACTSKLLPAQVTSYEEQLAAWHATHGYAEEGEDGPDADDVDDPPPPEEDAWVACEDAVQHTEVWAPPITVTGADRVFAAGLRERELVKVCNVDDWSTEVRTCLAAATETTTIACVNQLDPMQQKAITVKIAETDKLAEKVLDLAAKPAKVGCKQVVAAHYREAKWKSALPEVKGAERKKLIEASRKKLTKACTDESWSVVDRACMVGGGGEACQRASRWGFPAAGVLVKTGIAECDAYGELIVKVAACDKLPTSAGDSLLEAYTQSAVYWLKAKGDDRVIAAGTCKSTGDAIRQSAVNFGCTI